MRRLPKPFTQAELRALRRAGKRRPDVSSACAFLLATGLRSAEFASITRAEAASWPRPRWWHLRCRCRVIHRVIGKGDKERLVPLGKDALRASWELLRRSEDRAGTGRLMPWSDRGLRFLVAQLGERAGVAHAHPHRFRHSYATGLIDRGVDPYLVADLMGHTALETTKLYTLLSERRLLSVL